MMDDRAESPILRFDGVGHSSQYPIPGARKEIHPKNKNINVQQTAAVAAASGRVDPENLQGKEVGEQDKRDQEWLKEMRTGLMVMASVILSITYQAGIEHDEDTDTIDFEIFRITNTFAFAQSIFIIACLLSSTVLAMPVAVRVLRLWILLSLMMLATAYIVSKAHHTFTLMLLLYLQFGLATLVFRLASWVLNLIKRLRTRASRFCQRLQKFLFWLLFLIGVSVLIADKHFHYLEGVYTVRLVISLMLLLTIITNLFLYL